MRVFDSKFEIILPRESHRDTTPYMLDQRSNHRVNYCPVLRRSSRSISQFRPLAFIRIISHLYVQIFFYVTATLLDPPVNFVALSSVQKSHHMIFFPATFHNNNLSVAGLSFIIIIIIIIIIKSKPKIEIIDQIMISQFQSRATSGGKGWGATPPPEATPNRKRNEDLLSTKIINQF